MGSRRVQPEPHSARCREFSAPERLRWVRTPCLRSRPCPIQSRNRGRARNVAGLKIATRAKLPEDYQEKLRAFFSTVALNICGSPEEFPAARSRFRPRRVALGQTHWTPPAAPTDRNLGFPGLRKELCEMGAGRGPLAVHRSLHAASSSATSSFPPPRLQQI